MKREQLTNVTTESIDQRNASDLDKTCAMHAGCAFQISKMLARGTAIYFNARERSLARQRLVRHAQVIISLRSQQVTP